MIRCKVSANLRKSKTIGEENSASETKDMGILSEKTVFRGLNYSNREIPPLFREKPFSRRIIITNFAS